MKTAFNISKNFFLSPERVKEIAMFCIREAKPVCLYRGLKVPGIISFRFQACPRKWSSGRATRNCNKLVPASYIGVFVKFGKGWETHLEKYRRYKDSPTCICDGDVETFLHLVAHELGHAICGFDGTKTGEFQCENFAASVLDKWKLIYQPAACMI